MTSPASEKTRPRRCRVDPKTQVCVTRLLRTSYDRDALGEAFGDLVHRAANGLFSRDESDVFAETLVDYLVEARRRDHAERTREGLARARREGKRFGRPPALSADQVRKARRMRVLGLTHREIALALSTSQSTVRRVLGPL